MTDDSGQMAARRNPVAFPLFLEKKGKAGPILFCPIVAPRSAAWQEEEKVPGGSGWHAQDECWTGCLGWHVPESSKGVLVDVSA